ncbi:hypothetical protein EDD15DRAFT_1930823 [Pisolithus albus]|nr:hypothetical protein EDD15DRAFT_1930823 [Pisolithus albus]
MHVWSYFPFRSHIGCVRVTPRENRSVRGDRGSNRIAREASFPSTCPLKPMATITVLAPLLVVGTASDTHFIFSRSIGTRGKLLHHVVQVIKTNVTPTLRTEQRSKEYSAFSPSFGWVIRSKRALRDIVLSSLQLSQRTRPLFLVTFTYPIIFIFLAIGGLMGKFPIRDSSNCELGHDERKS